MGPVRVLEAQELLTDKDTVTTCGPATVHCLQPRPDLPRWCLERNRSGGFDGIHTTLQQLNLSVSHIFMPFPGEMNARIIVDHTEFTQSVTKSSGISIHHGANADGVLLKRDDAFVLMSGDCFTIVLCSTKAPHNVVVAHAGRESLLDRAKVSGRDSSHHRSEGSVVESAIRTFTDLAISEEDLYLKAFCGIRTGFTHIPQNKNHEKYNEQLAAYLAENGMKSAIRDIGTLEIDLYEVIRSQAIQNGIPPKNISWDGIDTGISNSGWASNTRTNERNLVIVSI